MKVKLTDRFVATVKATERVDYFDQVVTGLGLRVSPQGSKSWTHLFYAPDGRKVRMTLGEYPGLSLAAARAKVLEAKTALAEGQSPKAKADDVGSMLDDFHSRYAKELRSADYVKDVIERLVKPEIGSIALTEIRRSHISRMLDTIADTNGPVMADRTLAIVRKAFNWHSARDDHFVVPIAKGMAKTKPRERRGKRVLADDEIREIWRALDTAEVPAPFPRLLRTLFVTAVRRSEAARGSWPEIADGLWTIPAERMKAKQDHVVPLTPSALALIGEKPPKAGPFIFSTDNGATAFSGYSKAKAALDAEIAKHRKAQGKAPMPPWTMSRDVRRTCRTLMSRAGVASDHAERVLAHVIPGVEGVYDMWEYLPEKREALAKLAKLIAEIAAAD